MTNLILPKRNKLIVPASFAAGLAAAMPAPADAMPPRPALILAPSVAAKAEAAGHRFSRHDYEYAMFMLAQTAMLRVGGAAAPSVLTWNPLDKHSTIILSALNKTATGDTNDRLARSNLTIIVKRYIEFKSNTPNGNSIVGVVDGTCGLTTNFVVANSGMGYGGGGQIYKGPSGTIQATLASHSSNDIIMMAVDPANLLIWFGKNGTWSGSPSGGTGGFSLDSPSGPFYAAYNSGSPSNTYSINGGDTAFSYTPPAGFVGFV